MQAADRGARARKTARVLVASDDAEFSARVVQRIKRVVRPASIQCVVTRERLRKMVRATRPRIIVLDGRILGGAPFPRVLAELTDVAPVILVAAYEHGPEVAQLIAAGRVEFVPHAKQWALLATSLAERRLRRAGSVRPALPVLHGFREELAETFRHEINNPLTGILGNAELLLTRSKKRPDAEIQRIRTIVDLAVRLRETVRHFGDAWAKAPASNSP